MSEPPVARPADTRVLLTSSHSVLGSAVRAALLRDGFAVTTVSRSGAAGDVRWDPSDAVLDARAVAGHHVVVHLEGSLVPWYRRRNPMGAAARQSAVTGTELIVRTLSAGRPLPTTFVLVTSAVYYGDRGSEPLTEAAPAGDSTLARVAERREGAVGRLESAGVRVVRLRVGLLLHPQVHPLRHQLAWFRTGMGGMFGSGAQMWSWTTVPEVVAVVGAAVSDPTMAGPVNVAAPQPVTSASFAEALAVRTGHRARVRVPGVAVRLVLGRELADSMALASRWVVPARLEERGHRFLTPQLADALSAVVP